MGLLRRLMGPTPGEMVEQTLRREEPVPLEGTRMDLFNSIIPAWYADQGVGSGLFMPVRDLSSKVWIANRCQKLNSQAIAAMPLKWDGPPGVDEPMWVSAPDPNVFPNGIGDALHAIVDQMYGWGFSCQFITSRYSNEYPRTWTVLPSGALQIDWHEGRRRYRMNGSSEPLDPGDIVQIDRNPSTAAHGTPALTAHAQIAWGLLAAGNQSMSTVQGGIPQAVLKSERKLTAEQADALKLQWAEATSNRNGMPAILPPELQFEVLSINPADLSLLETQQWNAMMLAAAYGIPGPIVNMALTGGLTYQNPVALMQMWWLTELSTTSKRIMDAFSAQMLPRGQSVTQDATDMTIEGSIDSQDDPQLSQVAAASPAQQNGRLTAVGGAT
jgi:portal protein